MKLKRFVSLLIAIICMLSMAVPSFAIATRASSQIKQYNVTVTPTTGLLNVNFRVTGSATMNKIGCESIKIYEKSGSRWTSTKTLSENDSGMSKKDSSSYRNTISCNGESGVEYKVVVTVFAENSSGRDTRTQTTYVTGK